MLGDGPGVRGERVVTSEAPSKDGSGSGSAARAVPTRIANRLPQPR
ncbi:hypothetical protein [Streptomyces sp. Isolate_45]|nr:hypothetical protein [Streptomyces sp. Isolate_45]MDA5279599.1 hypothetical protein [Streptomyces sp. Isolate_45]